MGGECWSGIFFSDPFGREQKSSRSLQIQGERDLLIAVCGLASIPEHTSTCLILSTAFLVFYILTAVVYCMYQPVHHWRTREQHLYIYPDPSEIIKPAGMLPMHYAATATLLYTVEEAPVTYYCTCRAAFVYLSYAHKIKVVRLMLAPDYRNRYGSKFWPCVCHENRSKVTAYYSAYQM